MATTIGDLVEKTRQMTFGSVSDPLGRTTTDRLVGGSQLAVDTIQKVQPGALICCDLNTFYVMSVSSDGKTFNVIPSADGGPDVDCVTGDIVRLAPRATTWSIFREIHDAIADMASPRSGLFQPIEFESDRAGFSGEYQFPQGWFDATTMPQRFVHGFYQVSASDGWRELSTAEWNVEQYAVKIVNEPPDARRYRFVFGLPYRTPEGLTDELFDLGLTEKSTQDIPPLRAAARLALTQEGIRAQLKAQGDSRRPTEVPPRANTSIHDDWMRQYQEAVYAEASRLRRLFPARFAIGDDW